MRLTTAKIEASFWEPRKVQRAELSKLREYFSPFNLRLAEELTAEEMQLDVIYLLRDGAFPLTWFFRKNPSPPKKLKAQFLIPKVLEDFVPEAWREHSLLYAYCDLSPLPEFTQKAHVAVASLHPYIELSLSSPRVNDETSIYFIEKPHHFLPDERKWQDLARKLQRFAPEMMITQRAFESIGSAQGLVYCDLDVTPLFESDKWEHRYLSGLGYVSCHERIKAKSLLRLPSGPFEELCIFDWESHDEKFRELFLMTKTLNLGEEAFQRSCLNFISESLHKKRS